MIYNSRGFSNNLPLLFFIYKFKNILNEKI